ncbi:hypothetical protein S83_015000, partial [Arachis hypogaea]
DRETILTTRWWQERSSTSLFINQTLVSVSLELKDTDVRAYRTDPVQVRSWPIGCVFSYKTCACFVNADD